MKNKMVTLKLSVAAKEFLVKFAKADMAKMLIQHETGLKANAENSITITAEELAKAILPLVPMKYGKLVEGHIKSGKEVVPQYIILEIPWTLHGLMSVTKVEV